MRVLLLTTLLLLPLLAGARMYQWVNPASGRVELSGTPPAWYRSDESAGPRIQVFEGGQMVDDTAIQLTPSQNEKLREAAFEEFELRRRAEQIKRLERAARRERARRTSEDSLPEEDVASDSTDEAAPEAPVEELPDVLDQGTIDRLKDLIKSWDKQLTGG